MSWSASAPTQDVAEILAEDAHRDAREAWLLDDGRFLVLDEVHESYRGSLRWRLRMRQRRVLRLFVPAAEIHKLPRVEASLAVARRAYEMCEASDRYRDWQDGPAEGDAEAHAAKVLGLMQSAFRGMLAHARVILGAVPETASVLKVVPYNPPPVRWDEAKPAKPADAGNPAKPNKARCAQPE